MDGVIVTRFHRLAFLVALYLAYLAVLFLIPDIWNRAEPGRIVARLIVPAIELSMLGLVCAGFSRMALGRERRWPWVLGSGLVAVAVAIVYLAQIYSIRISNNFVSVLALQNADSAAFVQSPQLKLGVVGAIVWAGLFSVGTAVAVSVPRSFTRAMSESWRPGVFRLALGVSVVLFLYLVTLQDKNQRMEPGFRQAPLVNLVSSLYRASRSDEAVVAAGVSEPVSVSECYTFPGNGEGAPYPFQRHAGSQAGRGADQGDAPSRPNVIVIFAEGMSARMIGAYGGRYPGLTPNIDRLSRESMRVDNYYNHTAATFRGLIGQLSSGYSHAGGGGAGGWVKSGADGALSRIHRQTLPRVLGDYGYESHFLAPHKQNRPIIGMLKSLGFDRVHSSESTTGELLGGRSRERAGTGALDDVSLFRGLVSLLKSRQAAGTDKPLFLATYNIGTHAFLRRAEGEQVFDGHDSPVLDKFLNFDIALGEFLDYFERSPYRDNTLLVFTSDHATYPEPAYREVAGEGLKPVFVDRIPLLVRAPGSELPARMDAHGRNSLDLTPTVLELIGVQPRTDSFLGTSLFQPRNLASSVTALGSNYFLTTAQGVFGMDEVPEKDRASFHCGVNVVRRFYQAERENRIFEPSPSAVAAERAAGVGASSH
ncbi:hypothetical protein C9I47_2239 [Lysobacter maris]|uniref:Sulfatase N-terminal domain-containing protein n=2 Tax=Marilutibacter maris TaxID=1605891 RepID=A0A2U9T8M3_9GAMM|nr:hypothetical protein C9I47_2239 [Lysobacter maris]